MGASGFARRFSDEGHGDLVARLSPAASSVVPQHVILSGNNRDAVFTSDEDCQFFKAELLEPGRRYARALHAYVLMSNYVHRLMQSLGRRYARYIKSLLPAHWQPVGEPLQFQPRSG